MANQRKVIHKEVEYPSLTELARSFDVNPSALRRRIKKGVSMDTALSLMVTAAKEACAPPTPPPRVEITVGGKFKTKQRTYRVVSFKKCASGSLAMTVIAGTNIRETFTAAQLMDYCLKFPEQKELLKKGAAA